MPLALSDLFRPLTRDEVLETLLAVATTLGLKVTAWQPGQPVRTFLTIVAQSIANFTSTTSEIAKGGLLDYATGGWLTLKARSDFGVERVAATFATGEVTLTNTSGTPYAVNPGDLTVAHGVTGKTYRNTAAIAVPGAGSVDAAIMADEAGTASDAAPGAITKLVSSLLGVTVTNAAAVLGADEETDAALAQRCRDKLGSLSPDGPRAAYAYVAQNPALSVVSSPITRVSVFGSESSGIVTVAIANSAGTPSGPDVAAVQAAIDKWAEPLCVRATASGAAALTIAVTYQAWVKSPTHTAAEIETAINTRLAAWFKTLPIGGDVIPPATLGKVDVDALKGQIFQATPGIVDVAITLPAADVSVGQTQVPVLGTILSTITVVT